MHFASKLFKNFFFFNFQKAEAQLAYELQAAKIQQKIRNEEIQIQVKIRNFFWYYVMAIQSNFPPHTNQ